MVKFLARAAAAAAVTPQTLLVSTRTVLMRNKAKPGGPHLRMRRRLMRMRRMLHPIVSLGRRRWHSSCRLKRTGLRTLPGPRQQPWMPSRGLCLIVRVLWRRRRWKVRSGRPPCTVPLRGGTADFVLDVGGAFTCPRHRAVLLPVRPPPAAASDVLAGGVRGGEDGGSRWAQPHRAPRTDTASGRSRPARGNGSAGTGPGCGGSGSGCRRGWI